LKMWQSSNIWERQQQIKVTFMEKLKNKLKFDCVIWIEQWNLELYKKNGGGGSQADKSSGPWKEFFFMELDTVVTKSISIMYKIIRGPCVNNGHWLRYS
jgi:hypothetical protein